MVKKYELMNAKSLYSKHTAYPRQEEERIINLKLPTTQSFGERAVKAVEARARAQLRATKWGWVFVLPYHGSIERWLTAS